MVDFSSGIIVYCARALQSRPCEPNQHIAPILVESNRRYTQACSLIHLSYLFELLDGNCLTNVAILWGGYLNDIGKVNVSSATTSKNETVTSHQCCHCWSILSMENPLWLAHPGNLNRRFSRRFFSQKSERKSVSEIS